MTSLYGSVLCCIERERLEFALLEVRTRRQYPLRLRQLTREEQAEWDRRDWPGWRTTIWSIGAAAENEW